MTGVWQVRVELGAAATEGQVATMTYEVGSTQVNDKHARTTVSASIAATDAVQAAQFGLAAVHAAMMAADFPAAVIRVEASAEGDHALRQLLLDEALATAPADVGRMIIAAQHAAGILDWSLVVPNQAAALHRDYSHAQLAACTAEAVSRLARGAGIVDRWRWST